VEWKNEAGKRIGEPSDYLEHERQTKFIDGDSCEPPVSAHWRSLLEPLRPYGTTSSPWQYRQILDERIPAMAHLGLRHPERLKRGDFVRLAYMDEQGASRTLPYGRLFLADFEKNHCYDRFWDPATGWNTRYLCSGYSFVMVGQYEQCASDEHPGFFMDNEAGALAHFRYHYFQLGLLAHLQEASLLVLLQELSNAIRDYDEDKAKDTENKIRELRRRVARFAARYWFTEVTNHVQGRELFNLWRRHLDSDKLYGEVREQIDLVDRLLSDERQERLESWRDKMQKWRDDVSLLAAFGVAFSVVFAFFGMSSFVGDLDDALV
jgi:hypothetical protein